MVPIAIAVDAVTVGVSMKDDAERGTTRKTIETAASVGGGWGGGFYGATAGVAIGNMVKIKLKS